jgi:transcriptional regulator with XRE-family HTH domain
MVSNRIRERRIALGLSQVQLGILSKIPNSMISDFELGKRLPWPKARKAIAKVLKTSEAELFGNNEDH